MTPNDDRALAEARRFVREETQFHLGFLPTEGSHPKTRDFSQTIQRDTATGAAMLLSVDRDIPPRAVDAFRGAAYGELVAAIIRAARQGRRVGFSGCGATGRLAIILERMWREFWQTEAGRIGPSDPAAAAECQRRAERSFSIMTGGDRALIRSVERFEDFQEFGRRQVRDLGLAAGDLLVAITEGGETSSVIGTAWEAFERGCAVFFVFNNPAEVLAQHIERSRQVIECSGIVKIDLSTGPMALSGSTRLQATSSEMLVVGAAIEEAVAGLAGLGRISVGYAAAFGSLVDQLSTGSALRGLAEATDLETGIYRSQGLVTYVTDEYLLDVISDTTERTPTFKLPPFRASTDTTSPHSWAFAKDPCRLTRDAWDHMLRRPPRGLAWTSADYAAMGGTDAMIAHPPVLDVEEIYRYAIGNEPDPERSSAPASAVIALAVGTALSQTAQAYLARERPRFSQGAVVAIGNGAGTGVPPGFRAIGIPLDLPDSPAHLMLHLAVKLILNTLSTGTMGKLGRILGNWMIQVDATNKKLIDRATRIVSELAGIGYEEACIELHRTLAAPPREQESCVVSTLRRLGRLPRATS